MLAHRYATWHVIKKDKLLFHVSLSPVLLRAQTRSRTAAHMKNVTFAGSDAGGHMREQRVCVGECVCIGIPNRAQPKTIFEFYLVSFRYTDAPHQTCCRQG